MSMASATVVVRDPAASAPVVAAGAAVTLVASASAGHSNAIGRAAAAAGAAAAGSRHGGADTSMTIQSSFGKNVRSSGKSISRSYRDQLSSFRLMAPAVAPAAAASTASAFKPVSIYIANALFRGAGSATAATSRGGQEGGLLRPYEPEYDYEKVGECLVYLPAPGTAPSAIVHFLGGAFIGAAPDVFYSHLIDLLVAAGFLVVATPYNVTFDHRASAAAIQSRFNSCLAELVTRGLPSAGVPAEDVARLPVFAVGHSNGALMHVLLGTFQETSQGRQPEASVIISYNNRPASYAVPYFDQVGPAVVGLAPLVESFPLTGIALALAEQGLETLERSQVQLQPPLPLELLDPAGRFANQIIPVLGQVRSGVSEFTPTPADNRVAIAASYSVKTTLLVKFSVDSIDETDELEDILQRRVEQLGVGASLDVLRLPGTHATPLAPDVEWRMGEVFTPVDAVALAVKTAALADLRNLARSITAWLNKQLDERFDTQIKSERAH